MECIICRKDEEKIRSENSTKIKYIDEAIAVLLEAIKNIKSGGEINFAINSNNCYGGKGPYCNNCSEYIKESSWCRKNKQKIKLSKGVDLNKLRQEHENELEILEENRELLLHGINYFKEHKSEDYFLEIIKRYVSNFSYEKTVSNIFLCKNCYDFLYNICLGIIDKNIDIDNITERVQENLELE